MRPARRPMLVVDGLGLPVVCKHAGRPLYADTAFSYLREKTGGKESLVAFGLCPSTSVQSVRNRRDRQLNVDRISPWAFCSARPARRRGRWRRTGRRHHREQSGLVDAVSGGRMGWDRCGLRGIPGRGDNYRRLRAMSPFCDVLRRCQALAISPGLSKDRMPGSSTRLS